MSELKSEPANPWIPRLLLWTPAAAGGLLALLVLAVGSFPLVAQLQLQGREVEEKRAQEQQLPRLRADLAQVANQQLTAERQQQQLISLIAGSGELTTFMAQADREARRHGVQLQLYEPTAALATVSEKDKETDVLKGQKKGTRKKLSKEALARQRAAEEARRDPLQQAGLSSTQLLLSARGRFPNLLAFMRGMESLSLLVVQTNFNLNEALPQPSAGQAATQGALAISPVELKLAIALYNANNRN